MLQLMQQYIPGFTGKPVSYRNYHAYQTTERLYVIIPARTDQDSYYELAAITVYMQEAGFPRLAQPMLTTEGQILTVYENTAYLVVEMPPPYSRSLDAHGAELAAFHQLGAGCPFAPDTLSSYGKWSDLWTVRLSQAERLYSNIYQKRPLVHEERVFLDTFHYVIGRTELAIQYLNETSNEFRFTDYDQPTTVFTKYQSELADTYVLPHSIIYDHPARDLAEYMRTAFCAEEEMETGEFLQSYMQQRPLSVFGMRVLYARLIMPLHLFDQIEKGLTGKAYETLIMQQSKYEQRLAGLFDHMQVDTRSLEIPMLENYL
ncbi:hypothetical protein CHI12_02760 [Terribacillus saccharophilus]|uniref:Spore coat protein YutH n=1 Tax=Terribacillus saccharophilus TaxID=361277 RepID=A0A268HH63_9BACI|nr:MULTISPECIES: hypothetical protein [Terribacillus]PAE09227.1 hypothetical protein CHI12_02760 [Terribacillus saccharophilus]